MAGKFFCQASERELFRRVLGDEKADYILSELLALTTGGIPPPLRYSPEGIPGECHQSFLAAQAAIGGGHVVSYGKTPSGADSIGPARRFLGKPHPVENNFSFAPFDYFVSVYKASEKKLSGARLRDIKRTVKAAQRKADRKVATVQLLADKFISLATEQQNRAARSGSRPVNFTASRSG